MTGKRMPTAGPVRLADLIADGKLLWVYCLECGRERDVPPASLPLPKETAVPEVGKRMRCSACGGRRITTRPELYPGGIEAQRTKERGLPTG